MDIVVSDGDFNSSVVTTYVSLISVNDMPRISLDGETSVDIVLEYIESQEEVLMLELAPGLTIQG